MREPEVAIRQMNMAELLTHTIVPVTIEHLRTVNMKSNAVHISVNFYGDNILCGTDGGFVLRDQEFRHVNSRKDGSYYFDVKGFEHKIVTLKLDSSTYRGVYEFSADNFSKSTKLFGYEDNPYYVTHLAVSDSSIAAVTRSLELIMYNRQSTLQRKYQLKDIMNYPASVEILDENHVLISDGDPGGRLIKFKIGDELQVVWTCEDVGEWMCVDEVTKLIYTCSNYRDTSQNTISIISQEGL